MAADPLAVTGPLMRVAQLTATFPPYLGGAGNVCFHLSRELAERGHEVEVVTSEAEGPAPEPDGAEVHRLRPRFAIGNAPLMPEIAGLRGFDVLHVHYPFIFGGELALVARRRDPGAALVVSYHNRLVGERGRRPLFRTYEATLGPALIRSADRIAVVSEAHAETVPYLRRMRRRDPSRLAVLPNGVDVEGFRPGPDSAGVRERLGIPPGAPVAAFVATLDRAHYLKRPDLAISAAADADPGLHLLIAGGGEWTDRFRDLAMQLDAPERVHFLGPIPNAELPDMLRASDLLLATSDLESFGIVLIEAMACGLPVLATDLPGVLAVVEPGRTGLIARRGDREDLAGRLRELIAMGPEGRAEMGAAGRAVCEGRYAWPRLAGRLEEIYAEAVSRRRSRTRGNLRR